MELSSFSEAASCVATQELPSILWTPKVHYRVHKSPPLFPILSLTDCAIGGTWTASIFMLLPLMTRDVFHFP
jgi:hypothetical protein